MKMHSTAAVVIEKDARILLVKRKNRTFFGWWCLPGGHAEKGETPYMNARREASEEVGRVVIERKPFWVLVHDWPPDGKIPEPHKHKCHAFRAKAAGDFRAGDDAAELGWFTPDEARKLKITVYTKEILDKLYPQEYFVVVDKDDKIIRNATRQECHTNKNLIHRGSTVIVMNGKDEILLERRSMRKDLYPGYWGLVAGHTDPGESYEQTALREMMEEIGVSANLTPLFKHLIRLPRETEMEMVFSARHNGPFKVDKKESDEVRFFGQEELKQAIKTGKIKLSLGCIMVLKKFFSLKP
jgi:8-oxo-dGTP pyrophosphatase MutT (NUDIX family)